MENKWTLATRVGVGLLLAITTGRINVYFRQAIPDHASTLKIVTALFLAVLLYIFVFKPLLNYADAQREAKGREKQKQEKQEPE